jgi:hypothetical protein
VSATDLAGNRGAVAEGPLRVLKPARKRRGDAGGDTGSTPGDSPEPPVEQPTRSRR